MVLYTSIDSHVRLSSKDTLCKRQSEIVMLIPILLLPIEIKRAVYVFG